MTAGGDLEQRWVEVPASRLRRGNRNCRVHAAHWRVPGADPDAPIVVCVHGLGGSYLNWTLFAPHLTGVASAGDGPGPQRLPTGDVWAPDLGGFGLTPVEGRSARLGDNLDLLAGFVATVSGGRPAVVIGNSMGGLLTILLAARVPEAVAAAVLIDPAVPPRVAGPVDPQVFVRFLTFALPGVGEHWMRLQMRRLTAEQQVMETMRLVAAAPDRLDEPTVAAHVRMAERRRQMPHATGAFLQASRSLVRRLVLERRKVWADIEAVRAPVLLLHGGDDRLVQDQAVSQLAARRPDWQVRVYPDLGHVPQLEDPERVARDVAAWLADADIRADDKQRS